MLELIYDYETRNASVPSTKNRTAIPRQKFIFTDQGFSIVL
jgi:hypothetical protein